MKKKVLYIAAILICLSIITSGTLAYFTTSDTARNVITSDGVNIAVEEWQETAGGLVPYPKDAPIVVMPSVTVSKIVTVRNIEAESFIRARLAVTVMDADNNMMPLTDAQRDAVIRLATNSEDWTLKDGWWYYGKAAATGEVTAPLMTAVEFDGPNMTNEYQGCTAIIDVTTQAVQSANNGSFALDALGWPEAE